MIIYERSGVRGATLNAVLIAVLSVIKFLKAVKKLIFQIIRVDPDKRSTNECATKQ